MDVKEIRNSLHQIPELGRKEYKTKEYIINLAKNLNCKIYEVTNTGIVLFFNANKNDTICFRSDMDALPILEKNEVSYKSKNIGVMHACGHDGHMAMLLSYAIWASNNLDKLKHNIVCLFQPSEEDNAGANDIIKSNILDKLKVTKIFGFHIWPKLEENKIFSMPRGMLASSGEVTININGKSYHAANRKNDDDAIMKAFNIISNFYAYCNKIEEPHLINFGKINAGSARNIVPGSAYIEATLRAFSDDIFNMMANELKRLCEINQDDNYKIELIINCNYPSVINDEELFLKYQNILNINKLDKPFLQAEDFGCYTRKYKALFMLLGCGNTNLLHTDNFDFNSEILQTGVETYKKISCLE